MTALLGHSRSPETAQQPSHTRIQAPVHLLFHQTMRNSTALVMWFGSTLRPQSLSLSEHRLLQLLHQLCNSFHVALVQHETRRTFLSQDSQRNSYQVCTNDIVDCECLSIILELAIGWWLASASVTIRELLLTYRTGTKSQTLTRPFTQIPFTEQTKQKYMF